MRVTWKLANARGTVVYFYCQIWELFRGIHSKIDSVMLRYCQWLGWGPILLAFLMQAKKITRENMMVVGSRQSKWGYIQIRGFSLCSLVFHFSCMKVLFMHKDLSLKEVSTESARDADPWTQIAPSRKIFFQKIADCRLEIGSPPLLLPKIIGFWSYIFRN